MKKSILKKIEFFKKPKVFGLSISAILVSGCNAHNPHYGYETITVTEIAVVDYGPSDYYQSSTSVFEAYDNADHILEYENAYQDLLVTSFGGDDYIETGSGDDLVYGGSGYDVIYTHSGADDIYGEGGNDEIFSGSGDDVIYGGPGNDLISGGWGYDYLYGEGGNDTFEIYEDDFSDLEDYFDGGSGFDTLVFFAEEYNSPFYLDLSLLDAVDIEVLDLGGVDDEISVELTVGDVIDITDDYNELIIEGDSWDEVVSYDEGWEFIGEEAGAYLYAYDDVTLLVDVDIIQDIS